MSEDAPPSDAIPDKLCPKCGLANHGHAVYCMGCAAPLDRTHPPLRESGRLESFSHDIRINHEPQSQEHDSPTFLRAGSKPWTAFLRGVGFLVVGLILVSSITQRYWIGVGLTSLFLALYIGGGFVVLRRGNLGRITNVRLRAPETEGVTDLVGCLDGLLQGVGCIAIGLISIFVAFWAICMFSMGR